MPQQLRAGLAALALLLAGSGPAANFQALGPLYPIAEADLLAYIEERAAAAGAQGAWQKQLAAAQQSAAAWVHSPPAVPGLRKAARPAVRMFDPSITLSAPVLDARGNVAHLPGERVNPLTKVALRGRLVFVDVSEPGQAGYAASLLSEPGHTRVIAVAGSPTEFAAAFGRRAYFDQYGALSRRLGIREIPAVVTQSGLALRIETVALP